MLLSKSNSYQWKKYAYVRNPMNIHQVSKINLSPDIVDCIVFWSKNPGPMIEKLDTLKDYMYYFQFTLNGYEKDFETNLPDLTARIDTFQTLSNCVGKKRVVWRYDPIIVNDKYSIDWHIKTFRYLSGQLCLYTEKVTISFIDLYTKISHNIKGKNQRLECGCVASIDLGSYNTCQNGCVYCYANHNCAIHKQNFQAYDPFSPLLCSHITEFDKITERKVKSQKNMQLSLFDI